MSISRAKGQFLASILVLAAAAALVPGQQQSGQTAATVNGEPIPMAEVKAIMEQKMSPVALTKQQQSDMEKMALDMLIEDLLMRQFLRKNLPPANPADIDRKIAELQSFLEKQKKTLAQYLKEGGNTEAQLRADIAAQLQWKAYLTAKLPEASLKTYYDTNKVFFDKVLVRASHILVRVMVKASPADRQAALGKIQAIRQEILAGKVDFAQAAQKYSDCPSKSKGGDIGLIPYKFAVVEPFARAAFSMKVGDLSDVVASDFGYHLIKVTDRTKGETSDFNKIKDFVRDVYAQDLDLYQGVLDQQRKSAKIERYLK